MNRNIAEYILLWKIHYFFSKKDKTVKKTPLSFIDKKSKLSNTLHKIFCLRIGLMFVNFVDHERICKQTCY